MNRNDLPKPNSVCKVCGRPYYRCSKCIELRSRGLMSWKLYCDTPECFQVYMLLQNKDEVSKEEYKNILNIELPGERQMVQKYTDMLYDIGKQYGLVEEDKDIDKEELDSTYRSTGAFRIFHTKKK